MPLIATRGAASVQGFGEFAQTAAPVYIEDVFSTYLYTGNGSTQTITNNIDLSTKGGLVWIKNRSLQDSGNTRAHWLFDSARTAGYSLSTNSTSAQSSVFGGLIPFSTTGFSINTGDANLNGTGSSAYTYASWTFREQPKFFDIVTYTGNGSNRTIAHNLGSVPGCIIVKDTTNAGSAWAIYHTSLGNTKFLQFTTSAEGTSSGYWNNTTPTATEFTVGTNGNVNQNGATYVAYLFAHNAGGFGLTGSDNVISCGSFTTDGSGNATVTLGYEPQWLLVKRTDSSAGGGWYIIDQMRGFTANTSSGMSYLFANTSDAESTGVTGWYPTATGFGIASGGYASRTYIYIAIRRGPMKTPTSGTSVFTPALASSSGTYTAFAGFPIDMFIEGKRAGTSDKFFNGARLIGNKYLQPNTTAAEASTTVGYDNMTGLVLPGVTGNYSDYINWLFRRAPGFFDVVCFQVAGPSTVSHNLGVAPELIITKKRAPGTGTWFIYSQALGATKYLELNTDAAEATASTVWNDTAPTSSVFSVGSSVSSSETNVAYLFATVAGVSKVGSYTGNGSSQTINCGFTAGSRFVLIKRTDSTGGWYVFDSARGIVAGNDPYLLLNSTAAEVTTYDAVDTDNSGFVVNNDATNYPINVNGGTYIFLAIA